MKTQMKLRWNHMNKIHRMLCLLLVIAMVAGLMVTSLAELTGSAPCPNHTQHDAACGYAAAVEGHPCEHEHTDECYERTLHCGHEHTAECYEKVLHCAHEHTEECGENGEACAHEHTDECYEATLHCAHEHTDECYEATLHCTHTHDESCGYVEAAAGSPCRHTCAVCDPAGKLNPDKATFDLNTQKSDYADIDVAFKKGSDKLTSIEKDVYDADGKPVTQPDENGDQVPVREALVKDGDYILSEDGQTVTLKKEYLQTLPVGEYTLYFVLGSGAEREFALSVVQSPDEMVNNAVAAPNGGVTLAEDGDWNYKVDLQWITTDLSQRYDMAYATVDKYTNLQPKCNLVISTNAAEYEAGQMEIKIPATFYIQRDGKPYEPYQIGVPQAPAVSDTMPFNYQYKTIDGEKYLVFSNYTKVPSSSNYTIQIGYLINPVVIVDMSKGTLQATATATENKPGAQADVQVSREISYTLDTRVELTSLKKDGSGDDAGPLYYWPSEYGEKPADFDDYKWIRYRITANGNASQPNQVVFTDTPENGGVVYGYYPSEYTRVFESVEGNVCTLPVGDLFSDGKAIGSSRSPAVYVVVRYPKDALANGDVVTNRAEVKVIPVDGIDPPQTLTTECSATWQDYHFSYTGDVVGITKTTEYQGHTIGSALLLLKNGIDVKSLNTWAIDVQVNGYDYPDYTVEVTDDFRDWKNESGQMVQMTPDDYDVYTVILDGRTCSQIDKTTGEITYYEQGSTNSPKLEVYALTKGADDYIKFNECYISDLSFKDKDGRLRQGQRIFTPPEDTYRIKIKVSDANDLVSFRVRLWDSFRSDSPTAKEWLKDSQGDERFTIRNYAMIKMYDKDGTWINPASLGNYSDTTSDYGKMVVQRDLDTYGGYVQRCTNWVALTDVQVGDYYSKSLLGNQFNDTVNRQVRLEYKLSKSIYYHNLGDDADKLLEQGWSPGEYKGHVFYDLLPVGTFYQEEQTVRYSIAGRWNAGNADVTVETIDNYKGSGRQMVIFRLNLKEGESSYSKYGSIYRSEIAVQFYAVVPWQNIVFAKDTVNLSAYQHDGSSMMGGGGYPDAGAPNQYDKDFMSVKGEDGNPVLYDLRGDGVDDAKDTMFAKYNQTFSATISLAQGLSKWVRSQNDNPAANFETSTVAKVGGDYEYRLQLQNTDGGKMSDVILFDKLEQAANREGNTGETGWKGTFVGFDMRYVKVLGIKPTVYYNTLADPQYFTIDDITNNTLPAGWTTTEPADKSAITAFAVDLSKKTDGTDYVFQPLEGASVIVKMDAPDTMPAEKYAYNHSAFFSTFVPLTGENPVREINETVRTTVELVYDADFLKSSTPSGGATEEEATVVQPGQILTYNMTYDAGRARNNVVVTDVIPEGLSLVKGSIKYTPVGGTEIQVPDSAYDPATRTITWPSFNVDKHGNSTFTFQVMAEPLATGETLKVYANTAQIVFDGGQPQESNTTYHKQWKREAYINKTATLIEGVTATDANAATGGTAVGEDPGTHAEPVKTGLGQVVEYHMVVRNAGGSPGTKSGDIVVTDSLPAGTEYIPGSMTAAFRSTADPAQGIAGTTATATPEEVKDASGKVTGVKWTLNGLADGEEAYLTFRVKAPEETDDPNTAKIEGLLEFENTAHMTDTALSEVTHTNTTTVIDKDGKETTHTKGETVYTETDYEKDSETTHHQVEDKALHRLRIVKNLQNKEGGAYVAQRDEQFVFEITGNVQDGETTKTVTFHQIVTVPKGQSTASVDVIKLLPGEYTVRELATNWRFSIVGSASQTQTVNDLDKVYTYTYANKLTNEKWVDGKTSVTNVMPALAE